MGQHTQNVPNWHLQLLHIVLVAHADITAVSTHISPTTIICRLFKKACPCTIVFLLYAFQEITCVTMEINGFK